VLLQGFVLCKDDGITPEHQLFLIHYLIFKPNNLFLLIIDSEGMMDNYDFTSDQLHFL